MARERVSTYQRAAARHAHAHGARSLRQPESGRVNFIDGGRSCVRAQEGTALQPRTALSGRGSPADQAAQAKRYRTGHETGPTASLASCTPALSTSRSEGLVGAQDQLDGGLAATAGAPRRDAPPEQRARGPGALVDVASGQAPPSADQVIAPPPPQGVPRPPRLAFLLKDAGVPAPLRTGSEDTRPPSPPAPAVGAPGTHPPLAGDSPAAGATSPCASTQRTPAAVPSPRTCTPRGEPARADARAQWLSSPQSLAESPTRHDSPTATSLRSTASALCAGPPTRCDSGHAWVRFGACTLAGQAAAGRVKPNQDAFFVRARVAGLSAVHMFGVCDGHGRHGGRAASLACHRFPDHFALEVGADPALAEALRSAAAAGPAGGDHPRAAEREEGSGPPPLTQGAFLRIATALQTAARDVQGAMEQDPLGRFETSGTTLTAALLVGQHCIVANIGDSRTALCSTAANSGTGPAVAAAAEAALIEMLSTDHKPDDPREQARILKCGGLIQPLFDRVTSLPIGPLRVWNARPWQRAGDGRDYPCGPPGQEPASSATPLDQQRSPLPASPGLAMSRSIGDALVTRVGVVCDPTVTYKCLRLGTDRGIVLGSDGLWDVADAGEVAACVLSDAAPSAAAKALCLSARSKWVAGHGGGMADDVTVVVLRFRSSE